MISPPRKPPGSIVTGEDYNRLIEFILANHVQPSATTDITPTSGGVSVEVKKNLLGGGSSNDPRWG